MFRLACCMGIPRTSWLRLRSPPLLTYPPAAWQDAAVVGGWPGRPASRDDPPLWKKAPAWRSHWHPDTTQHHSILISPLPGCTLQPALSSGIIHAWQQFLKQRCQCTQLTSRSFPSWIPHDKKWCRWLQTTPLFLILAPGKEDTLGYSTH